MRLLLSLLAVSVLTVSSAAAREPAPVVRNVSFILNNPKRYEGKRITVRAFYGGWSYMRCAKSDDGKRGRLLASDTILYQGNRCIYMKGSPVPGYAPWRTESLGKRVAVEAVVTLDCDGKPFLDVREIIGKE
ncbi:MAG: hypothetical protein PHW10_05465 [Candidatus Peribacteraceae bacterium]|nr:hypothetical protein [Candidatus Peribacteraceae bacterium]